MTNIYVKNQYIQQEGDEVVFCCPSFVELSVKDENLYEEYKLNLTEDVVYDIKLQQCNMFRKTAYNELNQFELISDDAINGTSSYKEKILEIKEKFAKPAKPDNYDELKNAVPGTISIQDSQKELLEAIEQSKQI